MEAKLYDFFCVGKNVGFLPVQTRCKRIKIFILFFWACPSLFYRNVRWEKL